MCCAFKKGGRGREGEGALLEESAGNRERFGGGEGRKGAVT
jgi:hypothetical protein